MSEICRFCNVTRGLTVGKENKPIMENDSYFSLASIGALVDGWVLIIPKMHMVSMKDIYTSQAFVDFTNTMLCTMKQIYSGPFIAFEHGPNKCGSTTSCGTDHAHLHLIPYKKSLYKDMLGSGLKWEKCDANQISSYAGSNEYLFYAELSYNTSWEDHKGYLHILEKPVSQYFRRLIANQINRTNEYDYKKYAHIDVAIATNRILSRAIANSRG